MHSMVSPPKVSMLKWGWFGTEIPQIRSSDATYMLYEAVKIPHDRHDNLSFLGPIERGKIDVKVLEEYHAPAIMIDFLSRGDANSLVPSCTCCEWEVGTTFVFGPIGTIVMVYRDQQDCLLWYYCLDGESKGKVICSPIMFYDEAFQCLQNPEHPDYPKMWQIASQESFFVASSFTEFVYRTWVENLLWYDYEMPDSIEDNLVGVAKEEMKWYLDQLEGFVSKWEHQQEKKELQ
jgi:hypothetical protein